MLVVARMPHHVNNKERWRSNRELKGYDYEIQWGRVHTMRAFREWFPRLFRFKLYCHVNRLKMHKIWRFPSIALIIVYHLSWSRHFSDNRCRESRVPGENMPFISPIVHTNFWEIIATSMVYVDWRSTESFPLYTRQTINYIEMIDISGNEDLGQSNFELRKH